MEKIYLSPQEFKQNLINDIKIKTSFSENLINKIFNYIKNYKELTEKKLVKELTTEEYF